MVNGNGGFGGFAGVIGTGLLTVATLRSFEAVAKTSGKIGKRRKKNNNKNNRKRKKKRR